MKQNRQLGHELLGLPSNWREVAYGIMQEEINQMYDSHKEADTGKINIEIQDRLQLRNQAMATRLVSSWKLIFELYGIKLSENEEINIGLLKDDQSAAVQVVLKIYSLQTWLQSALFKASHSKD